jgi:hypothetical protein
MEDGKTGARGYGSIVCYVSTSNKSCSVYVKGYNDGEKEVYNAIKCNKCEDYISPEKHPTERSAVLLRGDLDLN